VHLVESKLDGIATIEGKKLVTGTTIVLKQNKIAKLM